MLSRQRVGASLYDVMTYTLPQLHTGKNWYVDFKCFDPIEQKMKRKKYMLDSIASIKVRRHRATEIITSVTAKLQKGWNPWADVSNSRQYARIEDIIEQYSQYLDKLDAIKAIKHKTNLDYSSKLKTLIEYNASRLQPILYIYQFDLAYISDFLDYILLDKDSSARTRNNYRGWLSAFCAYLVEKRLLNTNPVEKIKNLKEDVKFRSAISKQDLTRLSAYLQEHDKYFLLACQMEYYTFIRPDELSNIKLRDINIAEQKVFISGSISKNRRDGMVALNDKIILLMIELEIFKHSSECYIFGKSFAPSMTKESSESFRRRFNKLRDILKFPKNYQFYSLKDSGIRDLANAQGIVIARDQARHNDISTTNKYLKGEDMTVHNETKHFEGCL